MRQSYLKNAALMTGADVLLRLAGMGLRIYLANALGGEGMGLYQLVLAVYALVAGRCPGRGRSAGGSIRDALDGRLGGAAGVLHRPAAGRAQRAQPAGGTDRPHRGRLCGVGAGDLTGLGSRPKVHRGAGGHGPERGRLGLYDAPVLPPGGPALLCRGKGPEPP